MCGIIGYNGKGEALPVLVEGLKKMEYRGYDSSGVAVIENGQIKVVRASGKKRPRDAGTDNCLILYKPFQRFKQNVRLHRFAQVRVQTCLHAVLDILFFLKTPLNSSSTFAAKSGFAANVSTPAAFASSSISSQ